MSNTLTTGDKALVREIAREVAEEIAGRLEENMEQRIRLHQAECPAAKLPWKIKAFAIGIGLGSPAVAGGAFYGLRRLLGGP